ncbi:predicted protein [Streptomyces filamentosus NRRL 15998]|uniref:Predicted protein n=1 Tax=Streptomyces filamentosus NRRL 15998 TaxID=457431 RepID=D6AHR3_STRFL|nr:predicted protein [Streptomyces filamentosus NRRL 15998]
MPIAATFGASLGRHVGVMQRETGVIEQSVWLASDHDAYGRT